MSKPYTSNEPNIKCPYCGHEDRDSWDSTDTGETECPDCGKRFSYYRDIIYCTTGIEPSGDMPAPDQFTPTGKETSDGVIANRGKYASIILSVFTPIVEALEKKCDEMKAAVDATGRHHNLLQDERDQLRAQLADASKVCAVITEQRKDAVRAIDFLREQLAEANERERVLREWVPFIMHRPECNKWKVAVGECDCGLAALHAALSQPAPGVTSEPPIASDASVATPAPTVVSPGARDWPEDFLHENGNDQNFCSQCSHLFIGHKRRVVCKVCATLEDKPMTPQPGKPVIAEGPIPLASHSGYRMLEPGDVLREGDEESLPHGKWGKIEGKFWGDGVHLNNCFRRPTQPKSEAIPSPELIGECVRIGTDETGQPRLIIHTTEAEIARYPLSLAYRNVAIRRADASPAQPLADAATPTPETDAMTELIGSPSGQTLGHRPTVPADFARTLERQRDESRKDTERLDWLEANNVRIAKPDGCPPHSVTISASGEMIREAIDAARKAP